MVLVATQVKRRRGTTAENDAFTGAEGEITVDTEKHELRVHDGMTQGGFKIGGGSGSGRNIGDIFMTKRTDSGLSGAVECNGGTYNTTDYDGDGSIGELLEEGKLDYISLTDYATEISTKGWCDKIGWNGAGTTSFRVPTLTPHIIQKNNIPVVGNGMTTAFTNGTNTFVLAFQSGLTYNDQCFDTAQVGSPVGTTITKNLNNNNKTFGITTDGTKSGIIADTSDTAQLRVMIQLTGGATDEAFATCSEVLADVAGLKDMNNITSTGRATVIGWGMPDYDSGVAISTTVGGTFTMPIDGFVLGRAGSSSRIGIFKDNSSGTPLIYLESSGSDTATDHIFVEKGTKLYVAHRNGSHTNLMYFPLKGAN